MLQFAWIQLQKLGHGNYTTEADIMSDAFEKLSDKMQQLLRELLQSRAILLTRRTCLLIRNRAMSHRTLANITRKAICRTANVPRSNSELSGSNEWDDNLSGGEFTLRKNVLISYAHIFYIPYVFVVFGTIVIFGQISILKIVVISVTECNERSPLWVHRIPSSSRQKAVSLPREDANGGKIKRTKKSNI